MQIRESIIVEGRNDLIRIRQCIDADIIVTHGFGLNASVLDQIRHAYDRVGIIIFTDPDYSGERIRRTLSEHFPHAKHAYISKEEGSAQEDVGVEHASCESIRRALSKVHTLIEREPVFSMQDMMAAGLSGGEKSSFLREKLGQKLGLGTANAKTFLYRMNHSALSKEEIEEAIRDVLSL